MTTELFARKLSTGRQLVATFDWQAKRIGGVYFPDLEKLPIADRAGRKMQIQKIAGDCGCRFAAGLAVVATIIWGTALRLQLVSVSASPLWNYASVAGVFAVAAIAGKLIAQLRNQRRLRSLRDELKLETIESLLAAQRRER